MKITRLGKKVKYNQAGLSRVLVNIAKISVFYVYRLPARFFGNGHLGFWTLENEKTQAPEDFSAIPRKFDVI